MAPDTTRLGSDLIVASLQRELAEARAAFDRLHTIVETCVMGLENGDCNKLVQSLAADFWKLDNEIIKLAPGPSDAKGEGEAPSDLVWGPSPRRNRQMILELAELTGADAAVSKLINDRIADKSRTDTINVNSELYHAEVVKAITALKSRPSLTPLTDESVRGVLVDDGEPRPPIAGEFYLSTNTGRIIIASADCSLPRQVVRLRPASEFGVPAKPEAEVRFEANEGVPSLERVQLAIDTLGYYGHFQQGQDGWAALCVLRAHLAALKSTPAEPAQKLVKLPEGAVVYRPASIREGGVPLPFRHGEWINCDPALYGVDAGERVRELEAEVERLKKDNTAWEEACGLASESAGSLQSDAERLRKAIETHRHKNTGMACDHKQSDRELWSALTPPTAANGEITNEPEKRTDPGMGDGATLRGTSVCGVDAGDSLRKVDVAPSAPAAESEGDWQSHTIHFDLHEMAALESLAAGYGSTTWPDAIVRCKAERDALSARLAACEERCRELEAGIAKHKETVTSTFDEYMVVDETLWSLLAHKAEGGRAD